MPIFDEGTLQFFLLLYLTLKLEKKLSPNLSPAEIRFIENLSVVASFNPFKVVKAIL